MNLQALSLRDLHAVIAVADHAHFGRAARALRLPQPTLSAQVRKVEQSLGVTLFERTGRTFLVTAAGEHLLPLVRGVLASAQALAEAAWVDAASGAQTPFRLGVIPTLGPYLMPHLLPALRRGVDLPPVEIVEHPTEQLVEMLREGTLDAAMLSLPLRHDGIECVTIFDEPFRLIAPAGHPILEQGSLTAGKLKASEMVLLEEGHCLREQALAVCGKRGGATPRLVTTSLETLKYLIASSGGYSLLPALACDLPRGLRGLVTIRSFDDRGPHRRVAMCFRKTLPRREEAVRLARVAAAIRPWDA